MDSGHILGGSSLYSISPYCFFNFFFFQNVNFHIFTNVFFVCLFVFVNMGPMGAKIARVFVQSEPNFMRNKVVMGEYKVINMF